MFHLMTFCVKNKQVTERDILGGFVDEKSSVEGRDVASSDINIRAFIEERDAAICTVLS